MSDGLIEKIRSRVMADPNSGCWLWEGSLNWGGYGSLRHNGGQCPN